MVVNCGETQETASERPLNIDWRHRQLVTFRPQPGIIGEILFSLLDNPIASLTKVQRCIAQTDVSCGPHWIERTVL